MKYLGKPEFPKIFVFQENKLTFSFRENFISREKNMEVNQSNEDLENVNKLISSTNPPPISSDLPPSIDQSVTNLPPPINPPVTHLPPPVNPPTTSLPPPINPPPTNLPPNYGLSQNYPPQSYNQPNYPPQNYPPQNYPPQNYPPQPTYPPQNYPPQGYPQSNYPPQGYSNQGYQGQMTNPDAPIARGYCRVSTVMQEADGVSLETQHTRIRQHCSYKGFNLVKMYEDRGISGKDMNRPGLKTLFSELQPGDHVIITDLSRLSRSTTDALRMFEQFKEKKVYFVCLQPDIDFSTPVGELMFTVLMAVHRLERQNISSHVSNNMQRLSREGKLRARPPYGWRFVGKNKDYEKEPEQQRVIEKIKELYLRGGAHGRGMKYAQIGRQLNEEGENKTLLLNKRPTKRETPPKFHPEQIKRILIDCNLVEPGEKDIRIPIDKRIVSHRKTQPSGESEEPRGEN